MKRSRHLDIKLLDGTKIRIKTPSLRENASINCLKKALLDMAPQISNDFLEMMRITAAAILSLDSKGRRFTLEYMKKNGYDLIVCKEIITAYDNFLRDIMNDKHNERRSKLWHHWI